MGKVERALGGVPGVTTARANLTARSVGVTHGEAVTVPDLVAALANAGFAAQPRATVLEQAPSAAPAGAAGGGGLCLHERDAALGQCLVGRGWHDARSVSLALRPDRRAGDRLRRAAVLSLGLGALRRGRTNMDVPISIGVTLATALSFYETVTHGAEAWFDGTLMLLFFLLAGRALDAMMRDRARAGVDALLRQAARGAGGGRRWYHGLAGGGGPGARHGDARCRRRAPGRRWRGAAWGQPPRSRAADRRKRPRARWRGRCRAGRHAQRTPCSTWKCGRSAKILPWPKSPA
jgi:copper chaperone CopZ